MNSEDASELEYATNKKKSLEENSVDLRDRARQAKSPVETSVGVEKHFKLAASVFQPSGSSL